MNYLERQLYFSYILCFQNNNSDVKETAGNNELVFISSQQVKTEWQDTHCLFFLL